MSSSKGDVLQSHAVLGESIGQVFRHITFQSRLLPSPIRQRLECGVYVEFQDAGFSVGL